MTDAIVTDVDAEKEVQEPIKNKFDSDYDALVARREAEALAEAPEETGPIEDPEPEGPPPVETPPEVAMIELVDGEGNIIKVPATARYKAKVDGQEVDVPFEQMTRSYQKGAAADRRLEEASMALKEIETKKRELTEREQQFVQQQQKLEKKRDEGVISEDAYRAKAKTLLAALTSEDEDDPEGAIAKLFSELSTPAQQPVNQDEIAAYTEKRVMAKIEEQERLRQQQRLEADRIKANKRFESEYKDVIDDPIAYNAAKSLATEKWRQRPDAAPWEIASEVGNEIREWKKRLLPSQPGKKPTPIPRTVSARASIGEDKKPETREDALAAMKQARGQPV